MRNFKNSFGELSTYLYLCRKIGAMKYRIKKETKPKLPTYGKYKAVAVHEQTITSEQIIQEAAELHILSEGVITAVVMRLSEVINRHLRNGDRVRLRDWGLMKLEIEGPLRRYHLQERRFFVDEGTLFSRRMDECTKNNNNEEDIKSLLRS